VDIKRGSIYWADLNPQRGREPGKRRPVLVVQTDLLNAYHTSTIICPLTTNVEKEASLLRVHLDPGGGGLGKPSDVMIDQVRAIDNRRFLKRIGSLDSATMKKVEENLRLIMEL